MQLELHIKMSPKSCGKREIMSSTSKAANKRKMPK